jgi:neutral ceramidase
MNVALDQISGSLADSDLSNALSFAAGKSEITPLQPVPLAGRTMRSAPYSKIASTLEANLVIFRGARGLILLIGVDLLFSSSEFQAAIQKRLTRAVAAQIETLFIVASHTHNAPAVDRSKPLLGKVDETYFSQAVERVAVLIAQTMAAPFKTAQTLWCGTSRCTLNAVRRNRGLRLRVKPLSLTLAVNMVVGTTKTDSHAVKVLVSRDESGRAMWVLWQWACHATSFEDATAVSSDFPGEIRDNLRKMYDDESLPVVFFPGLSGDLRPDPAWFPLSLKDLAAYPLQRPFARPSKENFGLLCRSLTTSLFEALQQLTEVKPSAALQCRKAVVSLAKIISQKEPDLPMGKLEVLMLDGGAFGFLLFSAEVTSRYRDLFGTALKDNWFASGCCNHVFGYLPTDQEIAEGGYESEDFFPYFSLQGRFEQRVEQHILEAVQSLLEKCQDTLQRKPME